MIDGELFVPMKPSEYGVQANTGGNIYTTKDGLNTEDAAREFGAALETVVGKDYRVVPVLTVRVEGKRGRKAGSSKADGNGQTATATKPSTAPTTAPGTPATAPKATPTTAGGVKS
jgi:hypothetical protein